MRTICDNETGQTQLSSKLEALVQRWLEAYRDVLRTLTKVRDSRKRNGDTRDGATGLELPPAADDAPDSHPVETESGSAGDDAAQRELESITERSEALAALCDRLLQDLDSSEVKAAEIRFVVHKHRESTHPQMDPKVAAELPAGELVWELRQLIAWAGAALADVAETLDTRADDLDERGHQLLQDEITAVDIDLDVLKSHLADPVDWDSELTHLISGEVAPFDDLTADENDENDD